MDKINSIKISEKSSVYVLELETIKSVEGNFKWDTWN